MTGVNVLTQAAALITFPIYARYLQVEDFGLLDYIVLVGVFAGVVSSVESHQALIRLLPDQETPREKKRLISSVIWFNVILSGIAAIAAVCWAKHTEGRIFGLEVSFQMVVVAAVNWFISQIKQQLIAIHRALLEMSSVARISFFGFIVQISVGLTAVAGLNLGVFGVFLALLFGNSIQLVFLAWNKRSCIQVTLVPSVLIQAIRFSAPLAISSLAGLGWIYTDRYIAKEVLGLHEMGLLGVGYRFAGVIGLLTSAVTMVLSPLIYTCHEERGSAKKIADLFGSYVALGSVAVVGFAGYSPLILGLMAPESYLSAASLFPIICGTLLGTAACSFFPGLILAQKTKQYAAIQILGLAVNVPLSLFAVNIIGVEGVCLASLFTSIFVCLCLALTGHRYYLVPVDLPKITIVLSVALVISVFLLNIPETQPWGNWVGLAAPWGMVLLVFILRLIPLPAHTH